MKHPTADLVFKVRQLRAEQEHMDTIQIGRALGLAPHQVQNILDGHPRQELTLDDVLAVREALEASPAGTTLGEVAEALDLDVQAVSAIHNGVYDHLLPSGWDLV
jgi:plasmid maintenance system antidote protein VapI